MNALTTQRACPICTERQSQLLHSMNFELPASSPLPRSYNIVACEYCGMVYADSCANQTDYDKYYAQYSKYEDEKTASGGGYSEHDKERLNTMASLLVPYLHSSNRILDIGCANGGLLDTLAQHGFNQVTGVDPSPASVEHIRQRGFSGHALRISELSRNKIGTYQVVILSHVLEHVFDMELTMDIICDLLEDKGLLYIEVPDAKNYLSYPAVPFYYFDSEHINHFNQNMLSNLGSRYQFNVLGGGSKSHRLSATLHYPDVYIILQKKSAESISRDHYKEKALYREFIPDHSLAADIESYVKHCKNSHSLKVIEDYAASGESVIVWGAGSYTQRLLASTKLTECNIAAIVDSDKKKQGLQIAQRTIEPPSAVQTMSGTILLCAATSTDTIISAIKAMGIKNRIEVLA